MHVTSSGSEWAVDHNFRAALWNMFVDLDVVRFYRPYVNIEVVEE